VLTQDSLSAQVDTAFNVGIGQKKNEVKDQSTAHKVIAVRHSALTSKLRPMQGLHIPKFQEN
jgi:hypothetical protein